MPKPSLDDIILLSVLFGAAAVAVLWLEIL